jgi:hypothetical protein
MSSVVYSTIDKKNEAFRYNSDRGRHIQKSTAAKTVILECGTVIP